MNLAAYCRVSTDKNDQINSLESQKVFFNEFAKSNSHKLINIYADEGISGTKIKNRAEFRRLMHDATLGLFDMVIVKDISRFSRNTVDFLNSIRTLKAMGIETLFLTSNQTVMGNSEFILTIYGALAQEESANTSKRVKFGKKLNAAKGRVPNFVYGYDKVNGDYFNLLINESEAHIVRRIFELYTQEGYGTNKIAQILNNENIKTKRGYSWSQNSVARILSNEIYCGKVVNGKQEVTDFLTGIRKKRDESEWMVTERDELMIISPFVFETARKILLERGNALALNTVKERHSNKHLFSTLIKCKHCGYSYRRMVRNYQNTYIKWVCSGRNTRGAESCPNVTAIDEAQLKDAISEYFASILRTKKDLKESILKEFHHIHANKENNDSHKKELSTRLTKAIKSRQKYMDMYEDDLITREEMREKLDNVNKEIRDIESKLRLESDSSHRTSTLKDALESIFSDLESIMDINLMTNARLKKVIDKIVVDDSANMDVYLHKLSGLDFSSTVPISYIQT